MASPQILLIIFILVAVSSIVTTVANDDRPRVVYATPFITSNISQFRLGIEGASVDRSGRMYATAFKELGSSGIGMIADQKGTLHQEQFFLDQTGAMSFNGLRFLPVSPELSQAFVSRAVATDVRGHRLVQLLRGRRDGRVRAHTFCGDPSMAQPNDIAVATRSGRVYLSGGNFAKITTRVGDGDLWMCETQASFLNSSLSSLGQVEAKRLGRFDITNGIELSPDESTLYLSETSYQNGLANRNLVWKFAIDSRTGGVFNKTLLVDFHELDGTEWIDVDGIRADAQGNLFVTRNGPENSTTVVKVSPEGKLLLRIMVPGILEATNCELGGKDGTTLFIVGKCADNPDLGCVSVLRENSHPGRAWTELSSF